MKHEAKDQKAGFLRMLLGTLGAGNVLTGNVLTGKGTIRAGQVSNNNATYFDSFGVAHILKEVLKNHKTKYHNKYL